MTIGIEQQEFTEITTGVNEGQQIISTGAAALRPGDRIVMAGQRGGGGGRRRGAGGAVAAVRGGGARRQACNANQGQQPAGRMTARATAQTRRTAGPAKERP